MSKPLYDDPVVAEVHAIRAQMLAECGGDVQRLMQRVGRHQQDSTRRVITTPFRQRVEQSIAPGGNAQRP